MNARSPVAASVHEGLPGRSAIAPSGPGFTIVEFLIVIVLASVLGATAVNLFRIQSGVFRRENRSVEVDQNLRAGMDLMLRELRNAGMQDLLQRYADPPRIVIADSNRIRFKMDFHSTADPESPPDGDVLDGNEDIEYTYTPEDSTLRRATWGGAGSSGPQPMAEYVTRVGLTYYDAAGDPIPVPIAGAALAEIRRIHITLVGAAPGGRSAMTLESDVVPRNLGY